jgi:hypothetical protein
MLLTPKTILTQKAQFGSQKTESHFSQQKHQATHIPCQYLILYCFAYLKLQWMFKMMYHPSFRQDTHIINTFINNDATLGKCLK